MLLTIELKNEIAEALSVDVEDIDNLVGDTFDTLETAVGEYEVFTEEEANERTYEYIKDTLWAFEPHFMEEVTGVSHIVFKSLSGLYEEANEAVYSLVENTCGMDTLVQEAIDADGRGHFIGHYDGEEIETETGLFLYRVN